MSEVEPPTVGKGRPTPKRRDAQKRRQAVVPKDRKEAAKLWRERVREQRMQQRQALLTGDERHLPPRDQGPAKRLARDIEDTLEPNGKWTLEVSDADGPLYLISIAGHQLR